MRKAWLFLGLFALMALPAMAQEGAPKAEVYVGYAYGRINPGLEAGGNLTQNMNGWNGSFTGNITNWFGVVGDFGGLYAHPDLGGGDVVHQRLYTFMGGPQITLRHGRWTPFVHGMVGAAHVYAFLPGDSVTRNSLAVAAGGGVDVHASKRVSVRLFQADFLLTRFPGVDANGNPVGANQHNVRISTGLLFVFGR